MIITDSSEVPCVTVGDLRKLLRGLKDATKIICEDSDFTQCFTSQVSVLTHVVVGKDIGRTLIPERDIEEYISTENDGDVYILKLAEPIVCLQTTGYCKFTRTEP